MTRGQVFQYAKEAYGTQSDYPWQRFPSYAVFRHSHSQKCHGLLGSVPLEAMVLELLDASYRLTK